MPAAVSASRTFSIHAPIATESERALFQRRLALTLTIVFAMSYGALLLQLFTVVVVFDGQLLGFLALRWVDWLIGLSCFALGSAFFLRRGQRSPGLLGVADIVTSLVLCLGWAAMVYPPPQGAPPEAHAELPALLAASYTLTTRAALVPSTSVRSALIGTGAMAPLLPVTFLLAQRPADPSSGWGPFVSCAIWAAIGVASTSTISHIIYGLHLQVRKATQLGQYVLEDRIGEGGMGVVYRARHALLRRPTAIELLTHTTARAAERFEREVQITARLTHPNTVAVFDYGRTPDGVFYYAMEYLDGITLQDLVAEFGPQPASRVVHVLLQMCGALEEAHGKGLVHRDIKPANVMLTERGGVPDVVKVLDFGLVKEIDHAHPNVTNANSVLGTPHYMAPEAIVDPSIVDGRTDLYAVGATAYFLLTGSPVFDAGTAIEVFSQHLHRAPEPLCSRNAGVPRALEAIVLACLAKKPEDRPADAAMLAETLQSCGVAAWTRREASDWWGRCGAGRRSPLRRPGARSSSAAFAKTVAVALDDRGAA